MTWFFNIYICWADHFFHDLFQHVSFLFKLFGLTFKRNQSDLSTQLFLLKISNSRATYVYFMACSLNINEFRQVFYLFFNPSFFPLSTRTFEFELFIYNFSWWSYFLLKLICLNIGVTNQFTVTSYFYCQQLI